MTRAADDIARAASIIANGGVVAYPTETVYGIGCDPLSVDACERVRRIKGRDGRKPFLVIVHSIDAAVRFTSGLPETCLPACRAYWPGPLTVVITPKRHLPAHLYGPSGGVAIRVTSHPVAAELCRTLDGPLISTSANSAGEEPARTAENVHARFDTIVDMVLTVPEPLEGAPSTIVECGADGLTLIREGDIPFSDIVERCE